MATTSTAATTEPGCQPAAPRRPLTTVSPAGPDDDPPPCPARPPPPVPAPRRRPAAGPGLAGTDLGRHAGRLRAARPGHRQAALCGAQGAARQGAGGLQQPAGTVRRAAVRHHPDGGVAGAHHHGAWRQGHRAACRPAQRRAGLRQGELQRRHAAGVARHLGRRAGRDGLGRQPARPPPRPRAAHASSCPCSPRHAPAWWRASVRCSSPGRAAGRRSAWWCNAPGAQRPWPSCAASRARACACPRWTCSPASTASRCGRPRPTVRSAASRTTRSSWCRQTGCPPCRRPCWPAA